MRIADCSMGRREHDCGWDSAAAEKYPSALHARRRMADFSMGRREHGCCWDSAAAKNLLHIAFAAEGRQPGFRHSNLLTNLRAWWEIGAHCSAHSVKG